MRAPAQPPQQLQCTGNHRRRVARRDALALTALLLSAIVSTAAPATATLDGGIIETTHTLFLRDGLSVGSVDDPLLSGRTIISGEDHGVWWLDETGNPVLIHKGDSLCNDLDPFFNSYTYKGTFCGPGDLAVGPDGSLYVLITMNNQIWKRPPGGSFTRFAGCCPRGGYTGDGGAALLARLSMTPAVGAPVGAGLAVGPDGTVYVTQDTTRIRSISSAGIITTFAGSGTSAYCGDGGQAVDTCLTVRDIAVDADGVVFFSDYANNRIRRIGADGVISTVAGNGTSGHSGDGDLAADATLTSPGRMTFAPSGELVFIDGCRIRSIDEYDIIDTIAGSGTCGTSGDGGLATDAALEPRSIAFGPSGDLLVGFDEDIYNINEPRGIRTVTWNGSIEGAATDSSDAPAGGVIVTLLENWPSWKIADTTTTGADGSYSFADVPRGTYRVRFYDPARRYERTWAGGGSTYRTATPHAVNPAAATQLDVTLPAAPGGELTGTITDDSSEPIVGAAVLVFTHDGYAAGAHTRSDGTFSIATLPQGTYRVRIVAAGHTAEWYADSPSYATATTIDLTNSAIAVDASLAPTG